MTTSVTEEPVTLQSIRVRDDWEFAQLYWSEETGRVFIVSGWGSWSYTWPPAHIGGDGSLRSFLTQIHQDYAGGKFLAGSYMVYSSERTRHRVMAELDSLEKEGGSELDFFEERELLEDEIESFDHWFFVTKLPDASQFRGRRTQPCFLSVLGAYMASSPKACSAGGFTVMIGRLFLSPRAPSMAGSRLSRSLHTLWEAMAMKNETIKNPTGYITSRDYRRLWDLAQRRSVVCLLDHEENRIVAQTIWIRGSLSVSGRGRYLNAETCREFVRIAKAAGLEWLVPNRSRSSVRTYFAHIAYHLGDALSAGLGLLASFFAVDETRGGCWEAFKDGWKRGGSHEP